MQLCPSSKKLIIRKGQRDKVVLLFLFVISNVPTSLKERGRISGALISAPFLESLPHSEGWLGRDTGPRHGSQCPSRAAKFCTCLECEFWKGMCLRTTSINKTHISLSKALCPAERGHLSDGTGHGLGLTQGCHTIHRNPQLPCIIPGVAHF